MNIQEANKNPAKTTKKRTIRKKAQKVIVSQDNRFIYAKYDMKTNELKLFMWIVAQINSQKDQLFQICQIPLSEIMEVWQRNDKEPDYSYIRDLCNSMSRKVYIEDFKLLNEKTMKEVKVFQAMPLFKKIRYTEGQGYIEYQLNDSLMEYLLDLKRDFTQLKFDDIQRMKSAYSIRIYNMLLCELKQNKQNLKINLSALQNVLEAPKSLLVWQDFKRFVLEQAEKDINAKSNLVLLDIKTYKTGRKITDLEFIFDYKNNDKRIQREKDKQKALNNILIDKVEPYTGKSMYFEEYGEVNCNGWGWKDSETRDAIQLYLTKRNKETWEIEKKIIFNITSYKDIETLQQAVERADEKFYLDKERVKKAKEAEKKLNQIEPRKTTKKIDNFKTISSLFSKSNLNKSK